MVTASCKRCLPAWHVAMVMVIVCLAGGGSAQPTPCTVVNGNPCRCSLGNGKGLDVTSIKNVTSFLDPTAPYIWSPCGGLIDYPSTNCTRGSAICGLEEDVRFSVGALPTAIFTVDTSHSITTATLNYTAGYGGRSANLLMVCSTQLPGNIKFQNVDDMTYNFLVTSKAICLTEVHVPAAAEDSLSLGYILIILFFICLVLYFVLGTLYMHAYKDASGMEKIPHRDFWCGLPSMIKDGVLCLCSPCRGAGHTAGYDKI